MSKSTTGRQMLEALEKRVAELERQNREDLHRIVRKLIAESGKVPDVNA